MNYQDIDTPVGRLRLVSDGEQLTAIVLAPGESSPADSGDPVLVECARQLQEYFAGERRQFDLPMRPRGTAFQHAVWQALAEIPYGEVRSYRDIATTLGKPKAVRAVGAANGRIPLPIVVPCHRVIGSDGSLTGFAGGLNMKRQLLALEGALPG